MAKMIVNHAAGLVMPGAEATSAHGDTVEADDKNAAVASWITSGFLVKPKDFAKPVASSGDPVLQAALEAARSDVADRDATIAAQAEQIAKLTADLEAATKPAN